MTYYLTKYALSTGIEELNRKDFKRTEDGGIYGRRPEEFSQWFRKNDVYETKNDAISRAEEMRLAKIANLKKQIAKLEKMIF